MSDASGAVQCFKDGYSCSQAVLGTYGPRFDLDPELAFRVSAGFGGGMRMGETCGAVTGAFMVIGLKYGNADGKGNQAKRAKVKTYELVKEMTKRFKARNGSVVCKELLGWDISTPQGATTAAEKGLFVSVCPKMVQDAGEILDQILAQYT